METRKSQGLIGFQCDLELRDQIVRAASPLTVSQFLRTALVEKLDRMGFEVSPRLAEAPSRLGKGGPKPKPPLPKAQASDISRRTEVRYQPKKRKPKSNL